VTSYHCSVTQKVVNIFVQFSKRKEEEEKTLKFKKGRNKEERRRRRRRRKIKIRGQLATSSHLVTNSV
jgi:hypothetical protein